jgi:hypothetical protein
MSEFVENRNASLTANIKEVIEEVEEDHAMPGFTPPYNKDVPNPPPEKPKTVDEMPIPTPDEAIFKVEKKLPPPPVKKKRALSEKQRAHLARMRVKSLAKRKEKAAIRAKEKAEKEQVRQQKLKVKLEAQAEKEKKEVEVFTPGLTKQKPIQHTNTTKKKVDYPPHPKISNVKGFFENMGHFLEAVDKYNAFQSHRQRSQPVPIPKKVEKKPKKVVFRSNSPIRKQVRHDPYTVSVDMVNAGYSNPFGF